MRPASTPPGHLRALRVTLDRLQLGKKTNVSKPLHQLADSLTKRGMVVLISDLFDEPEKILKGLQHFRHRQHEVLVFHVLDDLERTFDYSQEARFVDLETHREIRTQPWFIKSEYRRKVEEWMHRLAKECRDHFIDYVPMTTSTPFDLALLAYLNKRSHLG